jgi:hypothetical protein
LKASLPANWRPVKTSDEEIFYLNFDTLEMQLCHPLDEQFKEMFQKASAAKE